MERVPPLIMSSPEGTYPDPAGGKLKQLHMKGTFTQVPPNTSEGKV